MRLSPLVPALVSLSLTAQGVALKPYRESPPASQSLGLGICTLKLDYHRPAAKGRGIWGELVPYGQVWRAGANEATTLTLSHPVKIQGKEVPAGTYALFILPHKDRWTWILNRNAKQWGAYFHKADQDVLRFDTPVVQAPHREWLQYDLAVAGPDRWRLDLHWAGLTSGFELQVEARGIYWTHLQEVLAQAKPTDWVPWFQAAAYCLAQEIHLDQAHDWIDQSLKAGESFWNHETKARFLRRLNRTPEALKHLERALELAQGKAPTEYVQGLETLRSTWKEEPAVELLKPKCCK